MTSTHETCNALRNCNVRNHEDLMTLVAVFSAAIKQSQVLTDAATSSVLDMLDNEISGVVENDQIEQQREVAWTGREIPGFGDLRGQLDALTLYQAAA